MSVQNGNSRGQIRPITRQRVQDPIIVRPSASEIRQAANHAFEPFYESSGQVIESTEIAPSPVAAQVNALPIQKPATLAVTNELPVITPRRTLPKKTIHHKNAPVVRKVVSAQALHGASGESMSGLKVPKKQTRVAFSISTGTPTQTHSALTGTAYKAALLKKSLQDHKSKRESPASFDRKFRPRRPSKLMLMRSAVSMAVLLILSVTGYVSFTTWQTNLQAKKAFAAGSTAVSTSGNKTAVVVAPEITPKGTTNDAVSSSALAAYKVANDMPRMLSIDSINVAARLMPMGVNTDNSLAVPTNINDAGWYSGSAKPGQPGAMLVDGHASETGTHYGIFGKLNETKVGTVIKVEKGDGSILTYTIVHTETVPLASVDMSKLMQPYGNATEGLNIITCTGKWINNNTTLDHRFLVYATRTS